MLSTDSTADPRFQVGAELSTQLLYGTDVEGWTKGQARIIDESAFGFPIRSLVSVPAGRYRVQALLHRYETFHRSVGHTVIRNPAAPFSASPPPRGPFGKGPLRGG
jgi:hypothetical protein